jgi:hypothetical protein
MAIAEKGKIINFLMKELSNNKLALVSSLQVLYRIMIGKRLATIESSVAILKT